MRLSTVTWLGLFSLSTLAGVGFAAQEQEPPKPEPRGLPFRLNQFLEVKGDKRMRVEDLKVTNSEKDGGSRKAARAEVNFKNLTDLHVQVSFSIAIYDGVGTLLAAGTYASVPGYGGFEPREADRQDLRLGFADLTNARRFEYTVVSYIETK